MAALNLDRDIDLLQGNYDAIAHFAIIGLQQILPDRSRRAQARPIVEYPPVAAVCSVPRSIAGALRV